MSNGLTLCVNFCRMCPIFQVSNVSGLNIDLLKLFLNILKANDNGKYDNKAPVEYQITDTFSVPGVGKSSFLLQPLSGLLSKCSTDTLILRHCCERNHAERNHPCGRFPPPWPWHQWPIHFHSDKINSKEESECPSCLCRTKCKFCIKENQTSSD